LSCSYSRAAVFKRAWLSAIDAGQPFNHRIGWQRSGVLVLADRIICGAVGWSSLARWDTLIVDYLWFALILGAYLLAGNFFFRRVAFKAEAAGKMRPANKIANWRFADGRVVSSARNAKRFQ
jgi:hypothetical protein